MTIARTFMTGRSQAIRIPLEYRLPDEEIIINRVGDTITLTIYKSATGSSVQIATRLVEYVGGSSYTTSDSNSSAPSTSGPDSKDEDGFFLEPNW